MKLQHMKIGERFEYEGAVYVKTGPLTASSEHGGQRIIPRYAVLNPLGATVAEAAAEKQPSLDRERLLDAFEIFWAVCESAADPARRQELGAARAAFLAELTAAGK